MVISRIISRNLRQRKRFQAHTAGWRIWEALITVKETWRACIPSGLSPKRGPQELRSLVLSSSLAESGKSNPSLDKYDPCRRTLAYFPRSIPVFIITIGGGFESDARTEGLVLRKKSLIIACLFTKHSIKNWNITKWHHGRGFIMFYWQHMKPIVSFSHGRDAGPHYTNRDWPPTDRRGSHIGWNRRTEREIVQFQSTPQHFGSGFASVYLNFKSNTSVSEIILS